MSTITLAIAEENLALWIAADKAVAAGQEYTIGGRSLRRADARVITDKIIFWQNQVNALGRSGSMNVRQAIPRDI
jgi:hypothetical protein